MNSEQLKKSITFLFFLFTICCSLFTDAHALEFKKQTLDNGLIVLHAERHNLPVVMVSLLLKVSPLNENKAGTAYLTSNMLTEGTTKRKASEISEEIEFIGASIGASTGHDYTTVSLSVLKKDIEKGFEIFSDVLLNPLFSEDELKRKKELIKGSLKQQEEEPSFIAGRAFIKEVFGGHPYGRLVEGSMESVDSIAKNDIVNFYKEHYLPENALLAVVGDITFQELDSLIKKYLAKWMRQSASGGAGDRRQETESRDRTEKKKEPRIVLIDKDITQANIHLGHMGISRDNPDYYSVSVMNYILGGGGFASRLMKTVRDDMGLAYSIHSSFSANKEAGRFEVEVQTKNESAATVIKEISKQIKRIKTEFVTDEELRDAKSYLTGSFPRRLETSRKIADFLTVVQFYNLGDDYIEKYPEYINRVTKEDILRVAEKYLDDENYILIVVGNQKTVKIK